jgi:hypothetical protein
MKDLGLLRWFLGMQIDHGITAGTLKNQPRHYIRNILKRFDSVMHDMHTWGDYTGVRCRMQAALRRGLSDRQRLS